jgi:TRAP-type C4-dicarboxylate transport system permease small subunit
MGRWIDRGFRLVEIVLGALLLGMVLMVFGNVVLRYGFNSGIMVSEELSRIFFVWLTFIGAIVAVRDGSHLGVDSFVCKLSRRGKLVCLGLSQIIIIGCCAALFWGTWQQHEINATTNAPVTEISMIWVFGVGYITSAAIGAQAVRTFWRICTGQLRDDELVQISETEEATPHSTDAENFPTTPTAKATQP